MVDCRHRARRTVRRAALTSRGISTSLLCSFKTTSAALTSRLSAAECTIPDSVFIEQGAITIPSVLNEPLEIEAA